MIWPTRRYRHYRQQQRLKAARLADQERQWELAQQRNQATQEAADRAPSRTPMTGA